MAESVNYQALEAYAGEHLASSLPDPYGIGRGEAVPDCAVAVYVAVGVDGRVLYVGSVVRRADPKAVANRLAEHLRQPQRLAAWNSLYLIPLREDTPLEVVRRIEGRIGAHLAPGMSKALPRLGHRR